MQFGFTYRGVDEAMASLDEFERDRRLHVVTTLEWFGSTTSQEMITQHSFQNRTWRLERSIGYHLEAVHEGHTELQLYALAPYAEPVEKGVTGRSRPYPFFWPVFYKWLPELYVRLGQDISSPGWGPMVERG